MAGKTITPISELGAPPVVGALRYYEAVETQGKRGVYYQPTPLSHYRATSADRASLEPISVAFGTPVSPWAPANPKVGSPHKWSVDLPPQLDVYLLGNPRGCVKEAYQHWDKDTMRVLRRCDGRTCSRPRDGGGLETVDCLCVDSEYQPCSLDARMWVAIPQATSAATWLVKSGSHQAAGHLGRAVAHCFTSSVGPVAEAVLGLDSHKTTRIEDGKKYTDVHWFPTITPKAGALSLAELKEARDERERVLSELDYGGWGSAPAALPGGAPVGAAVPQSDDEPVDAEIVEEPDTLIGAAKAWKERNGRNLSGADVAAWAGVPSFDDIPPDLASEAIGLLNNDEWTGQ